MEGIKNIINYKKPRFWLTLLAIVVIIVAGIGLLSNPKSLKSNTDSFLELTDEEIDTYEDYIIDFDDNKLRSSTPINIMKIYLHASKERNYEAEWELYIKDKDDMGWDKEYHMGIADNEKMGDYSMFENPTNIEIHYKNNNKYATITWEDKELKESDSRVNPFGFSLESDEEGIWKVSFMPIQ